jgi:RNA polymerase sigma factor (sigma-70 family)
MARRSDELVLRQMLALFNLGVIGELSDGQLLERFATAGGEAAELAFAALVERHGPMVLRICRNCLRDANDVEDAFQATFLVLVRRARALWVEDSLAPWVHRVARRIAVRARANAARRRDRERRAAEGRPVMAPGDEPDDGLVALLHEEIDRLPERCRVPVVLCDLEGLTHEQAARRLSWPIGTVKSRLMSGRERLRTRLVRRGVAPAIALMKTMTATPVRSASAAVPVNLMEATVQAARRIAAGAGATSAGAVPATVALLMEGAQSAMFMTRIKFALLAFGLVAGGAVVAAQQAGRTHETRTSRPVNVRSTGPAAARVDGSEDDAAADAKEMARLELDLLDAEVGQLRGQVNEALKTKVQYDTSASEVPPNAAREAGLAYEKARAVYLEKARALASRRRRTGLAAEPPKGGADASGKAAPGAEGSHDPMPSPSGSQAAGAVIGSIDMDAVFKRWVQVGRSQKAQKAALDAARKRLAKLQADAESGRARMQRLGPDSAEYRAAEDRLTALKGRIESEREAAQRDYERLQARELARLLEEIQQVIATVAGDKSLDYVVKVEGKLQADADPNEVLSASKRSVLYANPRNDITEEVVRELNLRFEAAEDKTPR